MLRLVYLLNKLYLFFVRPVTLGVRVMLIQDGRVLLVRQSYLDGWFMPGGRMKRGETLEQAARREVREEVGAELKSIVCVGAFSNFAEWKSDHNILFLSEEFTFTGGHDREVAEIRFFPLDDLPAKLWPGHRRRLEEYRSGGQNSHPAANHLQFGEW